MNKRELFELLSIYPDETPILFLRETNWDEYSVSELEEDDIEYRFAIFDKNNSIELDGEDKNNPMNLSESTRVIFIQS